MFDQLHAPYPSICIVDYSLIVTHMASLIGEMHGIKRIHWQQNALVMVLVDRAI